MGIRETLTRWFGTPAEMVEGRYDPAVMDVRAAPDLFVSYQLNKPQYLKRSLETYNERGYQRSALIFRCVQYVANAAGLATVRMTQTVDGDEEDVPDNPMRKLLTRPNIRMGESRFLSFVTMMLNIAGFVVIEKERDRVGNVIALWPLRSDWLRWIPRADGQVDWEYRNPSSGVGRVLLAEDVIPITYADEPNGTPTGIGPLEAMLREVSISSSLTDFLAGFIERGAMPLYFAVPSDTPEVQDIWRDQATADAFRESFRQRYGGLTNAVDVGIFGGIKDIKPLGFNFNELAYPELNDLTDARICLGFGVSPILIDTQVGLKQSTYANKTEARRSFYEDTMTTIWSRLDDAFTRHLLPEFTTDPSYNLVFDTSDIPALKADRQQRWQAATLGIKSGIITVNDARNEIGLKPLPGGDVLYVPSGYSVVRVDDLGALVAPGSDASSASDDTTEDPMSDETTEPTTDESTEEGERSIRAVPPIEDSDWMISDDDIANAIAHFNETFPDLAGLLEADVDDGEGDEA